VIGSLELWLIWVTRFPIKRSPMFDATMTFGRRGSANERLRAQNSFVRILQVLAGTDFFTGGGPHVGRTGDLLRVVSSIWSAAGLVLPTSLST
jgi:hypothetical protein